MTKTLTVLATLGVAMTLASTASAEASKTVRLVGKDAAAIRTDIIHAAKEVCSKEYSASAWRSAYAWCVDDTVARAMAEVYDKAS